MTRQTRSSHKSTSFWSASPKTFSLWPAGWSWCWQRVESGGVKGVSDHCFIGRIRWGTMGDNVTNTDRDISYLPETMTRYEPGLQTPGQLLSSHAPRLVSQCFKQHFHTKSGRIYIFQFLNPQQFADCSNQTDDTSYDFEWDRGTGMGWATPDIRQKQKQKQSPDWDCETRYGCQAVSPTVKIFLGWHIICNFGQTHGMGPGIQGGGSLSFWLLNTCRQTTNSLNLKNMSGFDFLIVQSQWHWRWQTWLTEWSHHIWKPNLQTSSFIFTIRRRVYAHL